MAISAQQFADGNRLQLHQPATSVNLGTPHPDLSSESNRSGTHKMQDRKMLSSRHYVGMDQ